MKQIVPPEQLILQSSQLIALAIFSVVFNQCLFGGGVWILLEILFLILPGEKNHSLINIFLISIEAFLLCFQKIIILTLLIRVFFPSGKEYLAFYEMHQIKRNMD
jgi:hypothetical protein